MMGEIKQRDDGKAYFQRGVTDYPAIGDPAALITRDELRLIYDISGSDTIDIGHLQQDTSIGAYINVDEMLSKHFAVLGTTGVGKSSGVALILRRDPRCAAEPAAVPARRPQRICAAASAIARWCSIRAI